MANISAAPGAETGTHYADIIIIGAGLSGTVAAAVMGRAGYTVLLIDRHATYPSDFRAEHLDGAQVEQLARLGMLDTLTADVARGETVAVGRRGRIMEVGKTVNFGMPYDVMVNTARRLLPTQVTRVHGRVIDAEASDTMQRVRLTDGRVLTARLLIVASGLGHAVCRKLGVTRRMLHEEHSLTFGFNMVPRGKPAFDNSFVVYHGEKIADRIDYLAIFRMGDHNRANLFTFRDYRDPWTAALRADPARCLHAVLPGLVKIIGEYEVTGKVDVRPMDLYTSQGHRRDGVVLIGDAFQTSCPAAGTGISRILTDVERLCVHHIPQWFQTAGIDRGKIAAFYDDPVKRACDAQAMHDAHYRRAVSTETGLRWMIHRRQVYLRRRLRTWAQQGKQSIGSVAGALQRQQPPEPAQLGVMNTAKPDHVH